MATTEIDKLLVEQTDVYKDELIKICKEQTDKSMEMVKKTYDELYARLDSAVKSKVMQSIGSKEMYDYTKVETVKFYSYDERSNSGFDTRMYHDKIKMSKSNNKNISDAILSELSPFYAPVNMSMDEFISRHKEISLQDFINKNFYNNNRGCYCKRNDDTKCQSCSLEIAMKKFQNLVVGEKIVIMSENFKYKKSDHNGIIFTGVTYELITTHARYLSFNIDINSSNGFSKCVVLNNNNVNGTIVSGYKEFNFWLPIDYINIINSLYPKWIGQNILEHIKNSLYDRKLIPLYVKDIVEENKQLKERYTKYETDLKELQQMKDELKKERQEFEASEKDRILQFEKEKEIFYKSEKPYIDVVKQSKELSEMRYKLQLVAKNLKLERMRIEQEKEALKNLDMEGFEL